MGRVGGVIMTDVGARPVLTGSLGPGLLRDWRYRSCCPSPR